MLIRFNYPKYNSNKNDNISRTKILVMLYYINTKIIIHTMYVTKYITKAMYEILCRILHLLLLLATVRKSLTNICILSNLIRVIQLSTLSICLKQQLLI